MHWLVGVPLALLLGTPFPSAHPAAGAVATAAAAPPAPTSAPATTAPAAAHRSAEHRSPAASFAPRPPGEVRSAAPERTAAADAPAAPRYVVVPQCGVTAAHWRRYGTGPWQKLCPAPGDPAALFAPGTVVDLQTNGQAVPLVHENPAVRAYVCRLARLPAGFDGC